MDTGATGGDVDGQWTSENKRERTTEQGKWDKNTLRMRRVFYFGRQNMKGCCNMGEISFILLSVFLEINVFISIQKSITQFV